MTDQAFDIAELTRRLANVVALGTIVDADYRAARVRVKIGDLVTGWLPWLSQRAGDAATWFAPSVGEQVMVLSPSGEPSQGVALMGVYSNANPAPANDPEIHRTVYADGAVIEYDVADHYLFVSLPEGGTAELVAKGGVRIDGDVTVSGSLTASGDIESGMSMIAAVDVSARTISLVGHTHTGGVPSGVNPTGAPIQGTQTP